MVRPAMDAYIVWLVSACACAIGIVAVRSLRLRRIARFSDLSWRGVIGLSLLAGALPAVAYSLITHKRVEVPPQVIERSVVPEQ